MTIIEDKQEIMNKIYTVFILFIFLSFQSVGQIYCPSDVTATCLSDLTVEECGNATVVSANYHQSQVKFEDDDQRNACNEGIVNRKFYIDADYSNDYTEGEPFCTQVITVTYDELPLNVQFPNDVTVSCLDEIEDSSPTWAYYPCDLVGYSFEDEHFDFQNGACKKIVRRFTVINWCEYESGSNVGLYNGIQIIKVVDNDAPSIANCEHQVFDAVSNCESNVTLTNSSSDIGDCPSGMLQWRVSIDLWGDGTEDLFYGPNELGIFKLDPIMNGEEVSIELPEAITISSHKVNWNVTDGCGNVKTCNSTFEVVDMKPPTPYCVNFLSATLNGANGGVLEIPVGLFSLDAVDNCSSADEIELSFSENTEDKVRTIECGEIGFQFFRIYYTDAAGNQDFCEVFMFVLDNGSCSGQITLGGKITTPSGTPIGDTEAVFMAGEEVVASEMSDEEGEFSFVDQAMMEEYYTMIKKEGGAMQGVDLGDYELMVKAMLGLEELSFYQQIAADVNHDGVLNLDDLELFRDVFQGREVLAESNSWRFVPSSDDQSDLWVDNKFSIMDYYEGFNFTGVKVGDLTETINETLVEQNEVNLIFEIDNNRVSIFSAQETNAKMYTISTSNSNVHYNLGTDANVTGDSYSSRVSNLNFNSATKLTSEPFLVWSDFDPDLDAQELFDQLEINVSILERNSDKESKISWSIVDARSDKQTLSSVDVYPTIFIDEITIDGNVSDIQLVDMNGRSVSTTINKSNSKSTVRISSEIHSGIYFLRVQTNGKEEVFTLVK